MLFCKGSGCQYRKTCSRYVLGCGVKKLQKTEHVKRAVDDKWMDHCINAKKYEKYIPMNGSKETPA